MQKKSSVKLPAFFDKRPDIKRHIEEVVSKSTPAERRGSVEKIKKFLSGELSWVEVKGLSRRYVNEMARIATMEFKMGHLKRAEAIFEGLTVIDHKNGYHHRALGAIFQKQKQYEKALEKYDMAILADEKDVISYANRGECYLKLKNNVMAKNDFIQAIALDKTGKNAWANRARTLLKVVKE